MVSDGSGVNSQRTISVSRYPPSCSTTSRPGQALHHVARVVEEDLGHHHRAVAAHREQVAFA